MNVAFVSNVVYPFVVGGAEKRIYEIGTRLADRGHTVTVYGRHFWDGPASTTHDGLHLEAVAPETDLYTDDRRSIPEALGFAGRLTPRLLRDAGEHDLLIASVFPYFPVFPTVLAGWRHDVPVVTTWHECWRDYWRDYLGRLAPGGMAVERLTANIPQHAVAVSGVTADRLAEIGPARDDIAVVHNGVDVDHIQSVDPVETPYDVLAVGRLVEAKRVETLLRAVARLDSPSSDAQPDSVRLGVIGDGPERDRLESLAENLGIADRVDFLGFLDDYDDVLAHLRGTRIVASASVREGFGITLVEALAADCTVVAVDHPNSAGSEVVGDAGFLVEPTPESLADGIDRALSGERPQTPPLERAREFDWDVITDRAESVYRGVITDHES